MIANEPIGMLPPKATPQELRQTRERVFGLTQAEFGTMLGVTGYSVYRWERGSRQMTEENTRAMRELVKQRLDAIMRQAS